MSSSRGCDHRAANSGGSRPSLCTNTLRIQQGTGDRRVCVLSLLRTPSQDSRRCVRFASQVDPEGYDSLRSGSLGVAWIIHRGGSAVDGGLYLPSLKPVT
jgi:hypothetical protein